MVMGEDIPMLRVFARTAKNGVPSIAILFQLCVTTLLLLTRSFEAVLDYIQFSLTFCSFLAVLGVIVLRIREPDLKRPYRMWGYPFTPGRLPRGDHVHDVLPRYRAAVCSRSPASPQCWPDFAFMQSRWHRRASRQNGEFDRWIAPDR